MEQHKTDFAHRNNDISIHDVTSSTGYCKFRWDTSYMDRGVLILYNW